MLDPILNEERERLADEREERAELWDRFDEPTAAEVMAAKREREQMPDTLAESVFAEMEALGMPLSASEKVAVAMEEAKIHLKDAIAAKRKGQAIEEAAAKARALAAMNLVEQYAEYH